MVIGVALQLELIHSKEKSVIGLLQLPELRGMPYAAKVIVAVILLDLILYIQHRIFHRWPIFWRLHKMHTLTQRVTLRLTPWPQRQGRGGWRREIAVF